MATFQYQSLAYPVETPTAADTSTEWQAQHPQPVRRKYNPDRSCTVKPIGEYDLSVEWYQPTSQPTLRKRQGKDSFYVIHPLPIPDTSFDWFHETSQPVLRKYRAQSFTLVSPVEEAAVIGQEFCFDAFDGKATTLRAFDGKAFPLKATNENCND